MAQVHGDHFDRSVYQNYDAIKPASNEAVLQTRAKVQAKFPGWYMRTDRITGLATDIYGKAMDVSGGSLNEKSANVFTQYLADLGLNKAEWQQTRNISVAHASYTDYEQWIDGHKVMFSKVSMRYTPAGQLQRVKIKDHGRPAAAMAPAIDKNGIGNYLVQDLGGMSITAQTVENDWVWFPVPAANGYELRPSWVFHITGQMEGNIPQELTGYADALTGEVLYRSNNAKEAFDVTIKGEVWRDGKYQPKTIEPLANLKIDIGSSSYNTDGMGVFNDASLNAPLNATVWLQGAWSTVRAVPSSNDVPSTTTTFTLPGTTFQFPVTTTFADRHVNAYYHVNRIHDHMKVYLPAFTGMDYSLRTNVDQTGGSCNAFYSSGSNSINFYPATGCPSFAEINDIVYHEYGHAINRNFYNGAGAGSMINGALNEGSADVWAMTLTQNPVLGQGAHGTPGSSIRIYNAAPKVYPKDIQGEVHADGEIIAGAWWDLATNLNSIDTMARLFSSTFYDTPDGPNGTEGEVYHDVLISAVINDDDDNNLGNGTPHLPQIVAAFARHGIYLLSGAVLNHTELAHQPIKSFIPVTANLVLADTLFFSQLKMYYKARSAAQFDTIIMTNNGGGNFTAQLPDTFSKMGEIVDYYFGIFDVLNSGTVYFPAGFRPDIPSDQSTIPYQFGLGIAQRSVTDFENDAMVQGWEIGNVTGDNATQGIWIHAVPVLSATNTAQGALVCQTGNDHTTGSGKCLVTGNANLGASINTADVDNGKTTAVTPLLDLSAYANPIIEYYRWFSNDRGSNRSSDPWLVQIHNENIVLWKNVDYTRASDYNWRRRIFHVKDLVATDRKVQVRFIAEDPVNTGQTQNGQSTVEALVDDFFIYDQGFATSVGTTVEELKANIYPNPANKMVNVQLSRNSTGTIGIYDLLGKEVTSISMDGANKYAISTAQLAAGTYMILVQTEKTIQTQKLVIAH